MGDGMATTLLAFPVLANPAVAITIVCFNWAVWTERTEYMVALDALPTSSHIVRRVLARANRKLPVDREGCSRQAEGRVAEFARAPPTDITVAYTDGSAKPNPGPCGSGYTLRLPGVEEYETVSTPWGMGDNNKGEMGGIHEVLGRVQQLVATGEVPKRSLLALFSDSNISVAFLEKGWAFPVWIELAHDTRARLRSLRKDIKVVLYWIRGHVGIPGNEVADVAAKEGARVAHDALHHHDGRPP